MELDIDYIYVDVIKCSQLLKPSMHHFQVFLLHFCCRKSRRSGLYSCIREQDILSCVATCCTLQGLRRGEQISVKRILLVYLGYSYRWVFLWTYWHQIIMNDSKPSQKRSARTYHTVLLYTLDFAFENLIIELSKDVFFFLFFFGKLRTNCYKIINHRV